jgi:hypothetical protein
MNEFNEPPSNQEAQEQLQNLLDAARKMRDAQVFNNPMFVDVLNTPEFAEYLEETYLMNRDRWN